VSDFEVEPPALRSSGLAIEPLAARLEEAGAGPAEAATEAVAGNPSYLTAAAIETFVATLESTIAALAESVAQHGRSLGNAAATYEHADARASKELDAPSSALDTLRPTITGLRRGPGAA
jgi:hypothetical protein